MKMTRLLPAADLADLVLGYYLLEDTNGELDGQQILSAPRPVNCLCIQLGAMVETDFRDRRPIMSVGGIQARIRQFRPVGSSCSLLIFPTALGSICFMPHEGERLFDEGYDLAGMIGDRSVFALRAAASAAPDARAVALTVDAWLRRHFERHPARAEHQRLAHAMALIGHGRSSVARAALSADLSERQLERSFREHLGVSPKRFQQIHRVARSLQAAITGTGDPLEGYSDQAHQIRNWQSFLGFSPGELRRHGITRMADAYRREVPQDPDGWAQFI